VNFHKILTNCKTESARTNWILDIVYTDSVQNPLCLVHIAEIKNGEKINTAKVCRYRMHYRNLLGGVSTGYHVKLNYWPLWRY